MSSPTPLSPPLPSRPRDVGHNRRFCDLGDAHRFGADFALICRGCGREVIIEQKTFISIVYAMGLTSHVESLARKLRCAACQCRSIRVELAEPGLPHALKLQEGDALPPRRMSITRWLKMSNGERRRYRRSLR